jgi:hypothetical protein
MLVELRIIRSMQAHSSRCALILVGVRIPWLVRAHDLLGRIPANARAFWLMRRILASARASWLMRRILTNARAS